MIPETAPSGLYASSKPRASGDDPEGSFHDVHEDG